MTLIFFNLFINSFFSLLGGYLFIAFSLWLFRIPQNIWRLWILFLPFLKLVFDFVRGLPEQSLLLHSVDPYLLPKGHQLLKIGIGWSYWGPIAHTTFSTIGEDKIEYAGSVGDYATFWLKQNMSQQMMTVLLILIFFFSLTLSFRRLFAALVFEKNRAADRSKSKSLERRLLDFRKVDIYISNQYKGSPFTGGIFNPYICIPQKTYDILSPDEIEAVIAHELNHIKKFDSLSTFLIYILGDIFWFVPGYRWLSRKIDHLREIVADEIHSASSEHLASALIKMSEQTIEQNRPVFYSAFFRNPSLTKVRIERRLGLNKDKPPRLGWQIAWIRVILYVWIMLGVLGSTFGGNHTEFEIKNPKWFKDLLGPLAED